MAVITLFNLPANTSTLTSLNALTQLIKTFNADKNIYSLVITGAGDIFFAVARILNYLPMVTPKRPLN